MRVKKKEQESNIKATQKQKREYNKRKDRNRLTDCLAA